MKAISQLLSLSLAALAVSGTVRAQDVVAPKAAEAKTIYEGVDAQGQIVRVTVAKFAGAQPVSVSTHVQQYPELHWTAHIGSGTAATTAH